MLRALSPVALEDTVLGQYTAGGDTKAYLDDETVPKGSKTPTFATCVMRIHNERCAAMHASSDYSMWCILTEGNCAEQLLFGFC